MGSMLFARVFTFTLLTTTVACGGAVQGTLFDDAGTTPDSGHPDGGTIDANPDQISPPPDAKPPVRVPENHRPSVPVCSPDRAPGVDLGDDDGPTKQPGDACATDADCTDGMNGRCTYVSGFGPVMVCTYDECFTDSDCGAGYACACGGVGATGRRYGADECVRGNCNIDSDCGDNYCSPALDMNGCELGPGGFYCHTPSDACIDDGDCTPNERCNYDPTSARWTCAPITMCASEGTH
jgi:hypothetical protein